MDAQLLLVLLAVFASGGVLSACAIACLRRAESQR
jgi:hypothetical protein